MAKFGISSVNICIFPSHGLALEISPPVDTYLLRITGTGVHKEEWRYTWGCWVHPGGSHHASVRVHSELCGMELLR